MPLRRELTEAERHLAVAEIDETLNTAKERLVAEIEKAKRAWIRAFLRGRDPRLELTDGMRRVLWQLYREGRRNALRESRALAVTPPERAFAVDPLPERAQAAERSLRALVGALNVRLRDEAIETTSIGEFAADAVRRRLERIPGARDAASRVVSSAFTSGLSDVFERNADAFGGWQYSAILDGGVCEVCAALDGTVYPDLASGYLDLPAFGPNPRCFGDGRCRCRLVPLPPA